MRGNKVSCEVREEICRYYRDGVSIKDLVRRYSLAEVTIRKYIRDSRLSRGSLRGGSSVDQGSVRDKEGLSGTGEVDSVGMEVTEVTWEQKVKICNMAYGVGYWYFLSKDEFVDYMIENRAKR